ncbi:MAG: ACT domain-containing protein [Firmicutes bacterium]|nr:ACT domain-containing protein [Bacillota bacterium]
MLRVLEAKRLMEHNRIRTVREAIESVGISRSAFYKYKDAVFPFYENTRGRTLTMAMNVDNAPGLLSRVLNIIAGHGANILTINQTIPINNVANVTVTIETRESDVSALAEAISADKGVSGMKILARE